MAENTSTWEMEYKLYQPFGRGFWTVCRTKEDAKFHLRNLSNNLPDHYIYVNVIEGDKETSHKGKGHDMYRRIFGEEG